jgi:CSLREA domain-containing protein
MVGVVTESPVGVPEVVRYVNGATATGAHNGTSWTDAYSDLAAALAAEPAGTKFWVAKGIYKPTATSDRSIAFTLKPDMALYGGFAGTETLLGQRNPAANPTVLSGDIDNNDTGVNGIDADTSKIVGNNSYHVVVLDGTTGTISSSTVLDGLTITGGNADSVSAPDETGGGVLCNTACDATLSNLYFAGNHAAYVGGAFYHVGASSPIVTNTTFAGNSASNGGAVYQIVGPGTAPVFANVTFAGNSVTAYGGAIYTYQTTGSASMAMTNVTFSANQASIGGAAMAHYNCGATLTSTLTNTIIWGNIPDAVVFVCDTPTFKNSVVQGSGGSASWNTSYGVDGGGNLDSDPLLGPLVNNGGSMPTMLPGLAGSAVNAGLDSACAAAPVNGVDQRGVARPIGPHCDIGAVELATLVVNSTADPGDGICDGTCTLRDAITATQAGGATAHDVVFDSSFNTPKTINLTATLPTIGKNITISGPGANLLTVRRDTGGDYRIFSVNPTATASFSGLTIANGKNGFGGGISNSGTLTIDRCTLTGNVGTTNGGAIQNNGALVVTNSTISGNSSGHGGGLYNYALNGAACALGCSATLINTTISGNTASAYAGGVMDNNFGGLVQPTVTLINSTVAGNSEPGVLAYDTAGPATITLQNTIVTNNETQDLADFGTNPHVISLGHNLTGGDGGGYFTQPGDLINIDPRLGTLGNYGGTTQTLYLKAGSPAIDGGDDAAAPAADQRGVSRPVGAHADIGAVEADGNLIIFQDGFNGP